MSCEGMQNAGVSLSENPFRKHNRGWEDDIDVYLEGSNFEAVFYIQLINFP
jgi:hypothetical protein